MHQSVIIKLFVTSVVPSKSNPYKYIQFPFEAAVRTLGEVHEALAEDGCIKGWRIWTEDTPDGEKVATRRDPMVIGLNGIAFVAPCHFDYKWIEEVGHNG